jgi:adenylate cyclase
MDHENYLPLLTWIADAGLSGRRELDLLQGFCERARAAGLPLRRAVLGVDTLHPVLEGRIFHWQADGAAPQESEYGRANPGASDASWRASPFFHLYESGVTTLRRRLPIPAGEFPVLDELSRQGMTDYVAMVNRFGAEGAIGMMDCTYSSWATDRAGGFADDDLAALEFLVPFLALAMKNASIARIAETLVETYLGHDAGHRVLRGHIERGVAEKISAVLWFSDLQGFTRITDTAPPEQIIPLLNDYAGVIVSAIQLQGGEVLKLIGDGILAIFDAAAAADACSCALDAAEGARARIAALNEQRQRDGLPVTRFYLGLHVGEVFYGNIGSVDRLDFTVVGPAVNEASRIAAMCRALDQDVLLSSAFAEAAGAARGRLVSVGRYALRGVQRPQELYTLDPETAGTGDE